MTTGRINQVSTVFHGRPGNRLAPPSPRTPPRQPTGHAPGTALERLRFRSVPNQQEAAVRLAASTQRASHRCHPRAGNQRARGTFCHLPPKKRPRFRMPEAVFRTQPAHPVRGASIRDYSQVRYNLSVSTNSPPPVLLQIQRSGRGLPCGSRAVAVHGIPLITASRPVRPFVVRRVKV